MYRILQSTDWSFLVGNIVEQICIGSFQVQVHLSNDVHISIEYDFIHIRDDRILSETSGLSGKATSLVSLLGKNVERVNPEGEEALSIEFSEGETLKVLVSIDPYESFHVTVVRDTIVV